MEETMTTKDTKHAKWEDWAMTVLTEFERRDAGLETKPPSRRLGGKQMPDRFHLVPHNKYEIPTSIRVLHPKLVMQFQPSIRWKTLTLFVFRFYMSPGDSLWSEYLDQLANMLKFPNERISILKYYTISNL